MVVVKEIVNGWNKFGSIMDLTDRYPEAMELFEKSYGSKNEGSLYHKVYDSTTPEKMAKEPIEYQCSVAYVILGRMKKIFQFREIQKMGKVIGFEIRECILICPEGSGGE